MSSFLISGSSFRQLDGKSLVEVNRSFLNKNDASLMHRVAAAEMMYLLEPDKKLEAVGLIEDSVNNTVSGNGVLGPVKEWKIQDCIEVHQLLKTVFSDQGAAERWKARCAEYFPYSTYFGGIMSAITTNSVNHSSDIAPENGLLGQQVKTKGEEVLSLNGSVHVVDGTNSLSIR